VLLGRKVVADEGVGLHLVLDQAVGLGARGNGGLRRRTSWVVLLTLEFANRTSVS
jgi:hypothetical protein